MVLSRLRILGSEEEPSTRYADDGFPVTLPGMLEYAARTWGEKVAVQQKSRRQWTKYSHRDIYNRSHEIAAGLWTLGLRPGDRVAIILENGIDWLTAYYGVSITGAIGVPIYYDLKPSEIEEMLAHGEPKMAVVSAKALAKVRPALSRLDTLIVAGDGADAIAQRDDALIMLDEVAAKATHDSRREVAATVVEPDDIASIVFTSGTSGGMKGVMLTHRNFLANCRSMKQSIPFGDRDRLVVVLPLHHAFPFTVTAIVAPVVGGEVTFENDLRRIRDRMAEVKPTVFLGVPALFDLMYRNIVQRIEAEGRLEAFERGLRIVEATKQRTGINIGRIVFRELHKRLGGSMRFMISGGAALNPQVAQSFARLGVPVLQGWGLTEAAPVLAVQRWNPRKFYMSNYYEEHFGTVGQALEGVEIGLIDVPEKELYVHLHGEGELVARGDNITPGYWRSEEATRAAKVGEWLRTGDVGSIDAEGNIWITGRSKFVIVLDSGEKVHPDEVEEKLDRSPLIADVVIIPRKVRGKTQVWAVIYPNRDEVMARLGGTPPSQAAVRDLIKRDLEAHQSDIAGYKRPTDFLLTDTPLPKTPLRKIARGQVGESQSFDATRWEQTWRELEDASETRDETEEALATTA